MITIEKTRCTNCGLCEKVCHEHCIQCSSAGPVIAFEYCSTCTQCIAVCPTQALSWDQIQPSPYLRQQLPSPEQLDELFKERRSTRYYKDIKAERQLLEKIVQYSIYAPTENFQLRAIIVDDEMLISVIENALMQLTRRIYSLILGSPIVFQLARITGFSYTFQRSKSKIEGVIKRGHTWLSSPAAIIFIVGNKKIPLSDASAQYALANITYYAQIEGLGSCLSGNGQLYLDKNKAIRQRLGLRKRENILGMLLIGYPQIRYANLVNGKQMPIQWNDGMEN